MAQRISLKRRLEGLVQSIVARTSFPPFDRLYRLIYAAVLGIAVLSLRNVRGVVSIYLTGGLASGEVVYGLSDIDLMLFVEREAAATVRRRLQVLSWIFPILSPGEAGVFSVEQLPDLAAADPHLRYRMSSKRRPARLLFGADLRASFQPRNAEDAAEAVFGRAEFLWGKLVNLLFHREIPPSLRSEHLCRRLYQAFDQELAEAVPEDASGPLPTDPGPVFSRAIGRLSRVRETGFRRDGPEASPSPQGRLDLPVHGRLRQQLQSFSSSRRDDAFVEAVAVCPGQVFPVVERELTAVVLLRRAPDLGEAQRIFADARRHGLGEDVALYLIVDELALCISQHDAGKGLLSAKTSPELFLCLTSPDAWWAGNPLSFDAASLRSKLSSVRRAKVEKARAELTSCLRGLDLARVSPLAFQESIWQTLQIRSWECSEYPLTSNQVCETWARRPGFDWLVDLRRELMRDLAREASSTERFYREGVPLLAEFNASPS